MECVGKIIIVFNYFWKKLHVRSLRGFWIYRVLNMSEFSIFANFPKPDIVLNMPKDTLMEGF